MTSRRSSGPRSTRVARRRILAGEGPEPEVLASGAGGDLERPPGIGGDVVEGADAEAVEAKRRRRRRSRGPRRPRGREGREGLPGRGGRVPRQPGEDPVGEVAHQVTRLGVEARQGILPPAEHAPLPGPVVARVAPLLAGVPGAQPGVGLRRPQGHRHPRGLLGPGGGRHLRHQGVATGGPRGDPGVHVDPAAAAARTAAEAHPLASGALDPQRRLEPRGEVLGPEEVGGDPERRPVAGHQVPVAVDAGAVDDGEGGDGDDRGDQEEGRHGRRQPHPAPPPGLARLALLRRLGPPVRIHPHGAEVYPGKRCCLEGDAIVPRTLGGRGARP